MPRASFAWFWTAHRWNHTEHSLLSLTAFARSTCLWEPFVLCPLVSSSSVSWTDSTSSITLPLISLCLFLVRGYREPFCHGHVCTRLRMRTSRHVCCVWAEKRNSGSRRLDTFSFSPCCRKHSNTPFLSPPLPCGPCAPGMGDALNLWTSHMIWLI